MIKIEQNQAETTEITVIEMPPPVGIARNRNPRFQFWARAKNPSRISALIKERERGRREKKRTDDFRERKTQRAIEDNAHREREREDYVVFKLALASVDSRIVEEKMTFGDDGEYL